MIVSEMILTNEKETSQVGMEQEEMSPEWMNQHEMSQEEMDVDAVIKRIELFCPTGFDGLGFLTIWLTNGSKFTVELDPRFLRVPVVLAKARKHDFGINAAGAGGWRSKSKIADAIGDITTYRVCESTVTAYVAQLLKLVKKTLRKSVDPGVRTDTFQLLERRRGLGVRLADVPTVIINGTAEETEE